MMLLTKENRRLLPKLYAQEGHRGSAVAFVKFFTPDSSWTWYAMEFDGRDIFFGLVVGMETEFGYFSLRELQSVRGRMGLPVERDRGFHPTAISVVAPDLMRRMYGNPPVTAAQAV